MKFADGTELQEQNITLTENHNIISISLVTASVDKLKEIFSNKDKTARIETDKAVYEGYTNLKTMEFYLEDENYVGTIELEYNGLSKEVDRLKSEIENLQSGILELTDLLLESGEKAE